MPNQAVSPSADERPRNGRPIANVSRDAFEGSLAIVNVNQVRTIEDSGLSGRDSISNRRARQCSTERNHARNRYCLGRMVIVAVGKPPINPTTRVA
jgi:hypothetical protein